MRGFTEVKKGRKVSDSITLLDDATPPSGMLDGENIGLLFDMLLEGAYCVDNERRIRHWNKAAEKITGYPAGEVIGTRCFANLLDHIDGEGRNLCSCADLCPLYLTIRDGNSREASVSFLHKDGKRVPISVKTLPIADRHGRRIGALELFHEDGVVESLRQQLACMAQKAHVDCLTGLANRHSIEAQLRKSLDEWERYDWPFACFISDIDHFKRINDTCGHDAGDQAIVTVMTTMALACRASDMVGRWGGDEAVGILENIDADEFNTQLQRIIMLIRGVKVCRDSFDLSTTVSIGGTVARKGDTPQSILKRADTALYTSKQLGRDQYTVI